MFRKRFSIFILGSLFTLLPMNTPLSGKQKKLMVKSHSPAVAAFTAGVVTLGCLAIGKILYDAIWRPKFSFAGSYCTVNGTPVAVIKDDITRQPDVDYIVNPANDRLLQGGGACGAIFRAAGHGLHDECKQALRRLRKDRVEVGEAVVTGGGKLSSRIVHVVPPNFNPGNRVQECVRFDSRGKRQYRRSYQSVFRISEGKVAVPFLSGGNFMRSRKDKPEMAKITVQEVVKAAGKNRNLKEIRIVAHSKRDFDLLSQALQRQAGGK